MDTSERDAGVAGLAARFAHGLETAHLDDSAALLACCAPQLRFEDPVSQVNGHTGIKRVMDDTWRLIPGAQFKVRGQAWRGDTIYTRWTLVRVTQARETVITEAVGVSQVGSDGLIVHHVDYWDTVQTAYRRIPVLGWVLERLRRRISSGWEPEPSAH